MISSGASGKSIRTYVRLWVGGMVACFLTVAISLVLSTNRLQAMGSRIFTDSNALESYRRLEADVLGERREALLWRATNDDRHRTARIQEIEAAALIVAKLKRFTTSPEERTLVRQLAQTFETFRSSAIDETRATPDLSEMGRITDALLQEIDTLGELNRRQMEETLEASERLNIRVDRAAATLLVVVALFGIIGAWGLTRRVLEPTLALAEAAKRYGRGDFATRVEVVNRDEFGMLCSSFNQMAEDIETLRRGQLHFVAAVAHDLKTPLMLIGGAARRLRRKQTDETDDAVWMDRIIEQVRDLEGLVSDLMDAVQVETGKLSLRLETVDLAALLRRVGAAHAQTAPGHSIMFQISGECRIEADAGRLERLFNNLISNAVKYSPNGSSVLVSLDTTGPYAVVTVQDEGIGIPEGQMKDLFKPFKRLGESRRMAKGTGLGLFSAKKIIDSHGGTIEVSSRENVGTTVEIRLPRSRGASG